MKEDINIQITKGKILYDSTYMRYKVQSNTQTEKIIEVLGWGTAWVFTLIGTEFQFGKMKKVLEMDGGDGYLTL